MPPYLITRNLIIIPTVLADDRRSDGMI